jgi:hypothetical protein
MAPKSNAQKCKESRERRLKKAIENGSVDEILAKERQRHVNLRAKWSEQKRELYREQGKLRAAKSAKKRKEKAAELARAGQPADNHLVPQTSSQSSAGSNLISPYSAGKNLVRAVRRIEDILPKSPRKKHAILRHIIQKEGVVIVSKTPEYKGRPLDPETIEKVIEYYQDDDISYQMPGIQDVKVVRQKGVKKTMQKKYLMATINETYQTFKKKYPHLNIGKSKFQDLRPLHVLLQSDTPQNLCLCKYHENIRMLIKAIKPGLPLNLLKNDSTSAFLAHVVCKRDLFSCAAGMHSIILF